METTLEKIELVKDRTGVSYKEAKEALEACDGSVIDAIISIEETEFFTHTCDKNTIKEKVMTVLKKGNVTRISIKNKDQVILNVPVIIGAIGVVLAPIAVMVATIAAGISNCTIEVVKENGDVVDLNQATNEKFTGFKEKAGETYVDIKEKAGDTYVDLKGKAGETYVDFREKAGETYGNVKEKVEELKSNRKRKKEEDLDFNIDLDFTDENDYVPEFSEQEMTESDEDKK